MQNKMTIPQINPKKYIKLFNLKESLMECYYELEERYHMDKDGYPNLEIIYINGQWFFNKEDILKYNFLEDEILSAISLVEKRAKEFVDFSIQYSKDFSNFSWDDLIEIFKKFIVVWGDYIRIIDIPIYCVYNFEGNVIKLMKENGFRDKDFDILTYPLYNTFHKRRHKSLLLLKMKSISRRDFIKRWEWSNMVLFQYYPLTEQFIENQLDNIKDAEKELFEMEENHYKSKRKYESIYAKLPPDLKQKTGVLQRLIYIRDFRYEQVIRGAFNLYGFINSIASRLNLTYVEMIHLTPNEVISKTIPFDLNKRIDKFAYYKHGLYVGNDVDDFNGIFNKPSNENHVKGRGVSPGKIQGSAKIILSKNDLVKINKGDIIVCDITSPDYLHALKKVSAIVANIGGFTSHSAIIAREFGIPCVVGVENATNIFKDEDLIEVDANHGIVRKIR